MKKIDNKKILLVSLSIFAFIFLFSIHISAFAQQQAYQPLAPIQGYTDASNVKAGDLGAYVNGMFKLGIAIAGVLAVLMIVIGGVEYVSTDAVSGKSDGKARIQGAVWGLVLALFSYILLNTINPDLLNIGSFQKNLADHSDKVTVTDPGLTPTTLTLGGPIDTSIGGPVAGSDSNGSIAQETQNGETFPDQSWNDYAAQQIQQSGILQLSPSDAATYFPNGVTADGYVSLLASIAKSESDFNPADNTTSHSSDNGANFSSEGLLSLSVGDSAVQSVAQQYGITPQQVLSDPKYNIQAGVQILKNQIQTTGSIAGSSGNHYWGPLYKGN